MVSSPITSWQTEGRKVETRDRLYFLGLQKSLQTVTAAVKLKLKDIFSLEEKL